MLPFEAFLRVRSASGGTFSPDGRHLAFLSNASGAAQVYLQSEPLTPPKALTRGQEIVRSVHWSPCGRWLLFAMDTGGSEKEQLFLLEPLAYPVPPPRALTEDPDTIHTFGAWSPNGAQIAFAANARDPRYFDIHVLDVASGQATCVLASDAYFNVVSWGSCGQLVVREHRTNYDQVLHSLDPTSGALRRLGPQQARARFPFARYLPGDQELLVCTDYEHDFLGIQLLDCASGRFQPLLVEDADVEAMELALAPNGDINVVAALNKDGWSELVRGRIRAGRWQEAGRRRLPGVATSVRLPASGERAAVSLHGPTQNPNVWSWELSSGELMKWSSEPFGEVQTGSLVEPALIHYPTHDGLEIPAWLYRPATAHGPGPVVVHVHGGPESQDRPGFSAVYQYLVQRGYTVLAPNVRGSSGYGNHYCHLDDVERRYDALLDVEFAHRWLRESDIGAPDRIAIMGASYGGFTVLYCLTRQPELWAAGVDIVGLANFETFFEHTGPWRRHLRACEYGDPERHAALLRDLSPIHHIDRIQAPLIVVQGANDPRVPQEESDQIVEQLRARGQEVEYLLFRDEGHGIVKVPNRIVAYTAIGEFLDRHLEPDGF
jgi:dipeptidyl aminopeptidase/acylaminoacyl peptidase